MMLFIILTNRFKLIEIGLNKYNNNECSESQSLTFNDLIFISN